MGRVRIDALLAYNVYVWAMRVLYDAEVDWAAKHHLAGFIITWPEPVNPRSEAALHARITELLASGWSPPPGFLRPEADGPPQLMLPG